MLRTEGEAGGVIGRGDHTHNAVAPSLPCFFPLFLSLPFHSPSPPPSLSLPPYPSRVTFFIHLIEFNSQGVCDGEESLRRSGGQLPHKADSGTHLCQGKEIEKTLAQEIVHLRIDSTFLSLSSSLSHTHTHTHTHTLSHTLSVSVSVSLSLPFFVNVIHVAFREFDRFISEKHERTNI
jgi:hypothetical protein